MGAQGIKATTAASSNAKDTLAKLVRKPHRKMPSTARVAALALSTSRPCHNMGVAESRYCRCHGCFHEKKLLQCKYYLSHQRLMCSGKVTNQTVERLKGGLMLLIGCSKRLQLRLHHDI